MRGPTWRASCGGAKHPRCGLRSHQDRLRLCHCHRVSRSGADCGGDAPVLEVARLTSADGPAILAKRTGYVGPENDSWGIILRGLQPHKHLDGCYRMSGGQQTGGTSLFDLAASSGRPDLLGAAALAGPRRRHPMSGSNDLGYPPITPSMPRGALGVWRPQT